jgi:uncharacterized membrane protein affecting hemolysin expression
MDVKPTGETIARALREPRGYAVAIAAFASLATSLLIGLAIAWQNARARETQVEQFGRATVKQLASLSVEPLIALDKIHLGVLVTRLADLDAVRLAAVLTLDDRVVATAGTESLEGAHEFTEPIGIEGEIAGYARVVVEDDAIGRSFSPGFAVWLMVVLAGLMAGFELQPRLSLRAASSRADRRRRRGRRRRGATVPDGRQLLQPEPHQRDSARRGAAPCARPARARRIGDAQSIARLARHRLDLAEPNESVGWRRRLRCVLRRARGRGAAR